MKLALFEIDKKAIFPYFFKNPLNNIDIGLTWVFGLNENIIKINNNKNVKLLGQDLIDVTLKGGQYIGEPKKYYLVFKVAVSSLKSCFPSIAFFNPHPMVSTRKIKFDEFFGLI